MKRGSNGSGSDAHDSSGNGRFDVRHEAADRLDTRVISLATLDLVDRRRRNSRKLGETLNLFHRQRLQRVADLL